MTAWSSPLRLAGSGLISHASKSTIDDAGLFPRRISTIYPKPNGAHISMMCLTEDGGIYYGKDDQGGQRLRLNEWLFGHLANDLGIATPGMSILERPDRSTLFGSLSPASIAGMFDVQTYLTSPHRNELGQISKWLDGYLARLYIYDLFIGNPDRSLQNYLVDRSGGGNRLLAFDFASADVASLTSGQFPVASTPTVSVGRHLRRIHGFDASIAAEMIERIAAIPRGSIERIVSGLPDDWIDADKKEALCDGWMGAKAKTRVASLRAGLADGSIL